MDSLRVCLSIASKRMEHSFLKFLSISVPEYVRLKVLQAYLKDAGEAPGAFFASNDNLPSLSNSVGEGFEVMINGDSANEENS